MVKYIVMLGGLAVKYATKKSAETAAKNMGGKLLSKPTQKILDKAVSPKSLKNNPTLMEKVKSQIGIAPKQTRTMPRPGKIDQKKGIAVGKLSQTAYKRQKQGKALLAGTALYEAGRLMGDKDDGAKADGKADGKDKRSFMQKYVLGARFQPKSDNSKDNKTVTKKQKDAIRGSSDKKSTKKGMSPFEKAFAKARSNKQSTFKFKTKDGEKTFTTKLKETPKKKSKTKKGANT